jgi:hypothetical protein
MRVIYVYKHTHNSHGDRIQSPKFYVLIKERTMDNVQNCGNYKNGGSIISLPRYTRMFMAW